MQPADMLEGRELDGGWKVIRRLVRKPTATGGNFSTGYVVRHSSGREGFLKAMDYTAAFHSPNTAAALSAMTHAYLFEKNVCEKCSLHHLRRVVHAIESGTIQADPNNTFSKVEYLIFELADGDIRAHLDTQGKFDLAFALRTLHHIATGLEQLHRADMAHQDLKPSNVLVFEKAVGSKISDFGRAWGKDFSAAHDDFPIPGDTGYAPPELLYGHVAVDVSMRRYGCDMYHLGSMAAFLFTQAHMNALIGKNLAPAHYPFSWGGKYAEVLPYVQAAFAKALDSFEAAVPDGFKAPLRSAVSLLCEPDPNKRGHPMNRQGHSNQFGLERFISDFNRLALKAELELTGGPK